MKQKIELTVETPTMIGYAESYLAFIPKKQPKVPAPNDKKGFIPFRIRRLTITNKRFNNSFKFSFTRRNGGYTIGDERLKDTAYIIKSVSLSALKAELTGWFGAADALRLIDVLMT